MGGSYVTYIGNKPIVVVGGKPGGCIWSRVDRQPAVGASLGLLAVDSVAGDVAVGSRRAGEGEKCKDRHVRCLSGGLLWFDEGVYWTSSSVNEVYGNECVGMIESIENE